LKEGFVPATAFLGTILDTYRDSAVALVGCRSRGMGRYSCEYDALVVTGDRRPRTTFKVGDGFVDLFFSTEREALNPANPELALSLAMAKPVRDSSLILSTSSAANLATVAGLARKASERRLASALKIIGRSEAALGKGSVIDADFWLLAASYELAYALLLSSETLPSPSHLLSQLREPKRRINGFEGFSIGTGLEAASRAGCGARLEGITVLHDLFREGKVESFDSDWPKARTELLSAKAQELVTRMELAECYSFLGQELVDDMMRLMKKNPRRTIASLTAGKDRLIGERLTRQLGLARTEEAIKAGLAVVKSQASSFARSG